MLELFIIVILEASAYFHSIYKFPYNQRFIFIYIINQSTNIFHLSSKNF